MHKTPFFTFLDPDLTTRITAAAPADFEISVHPADLSHAEKTPLVATTDFLILFPGHLSPNVLRAATRLKLIQLLSAGYEHMELDLCTQLGIPVANNGGANAVDVAEHTLGLILALYRRLAEQDRAVHRGDWNLLDSGRTTYTIHGKTAALIGLGHIGRHVAARLAALHAALRRRRSSRAAGVAAARRRASRGVERSHHDAHGDAATPLLSFRRGLRRAPRCVARGL